MAGRLTLRFADADVLPLRMENYAETVNRYVSEVVTLADDLRADTVQHNRLVEMDAFRLQADPTQTYNPPMSKDEVPFFDFASTDLDRMLGEQLSNGVLSPVRMTEINRILQKIEQAMTDTDGLPGRPWFRHTIYAPGFYTGYGVKTLPGIREAIEQREWHLVEPQMERIAAALDRVTELLRQATGGLVS